MPQGKLNCASALVPFEKPGLGPVAGGTEPAIVLTTQLVPTGWISRTVKLAVSVTYRWLLTSMAMPVGLQNLAWLLVPSALPCTPARPAMVLTIQFVPVGLIFLTAWL